MNLIPPIFLASQSPRRQELLTQIGAQFTVVHAEVDESPLPAENPEGYVRRIALAKAKAGRRVAKASDIPVLGADTAVVLDQAILGKPGTASNAARMLKRLSGRTHEVMSGVAVILGDQQWVELQISQVRFKVLQDAEIHAYCRTGEPLDKAGAYAIQGLAAGFVAHLDGSYSGVMGLPLFETCALLQRITDPDAAP